MSRVVLKEGWLKPQAVYGLFPCQADGDDLIIYDPASCRSTDISPLAKVPSFRANLMMSILPSRITLPA